MAIRLFVVGDTKEDYFIAAENEYKKRISRYAKLDYSVIPSSKKATERAACLTIEEQHILKKINPGDFVILLDENGKEFTSRKFADNLNKWMYSRPQIVFVIGGAFGFSEKVKLRADAKLSLSRLTFPHHMVRTIFLEQLYRAFTILNGESYHND